MQSMFNEMSRRAFVGSMGAVVAMAALGGCAPKAGGGKGANSGYAAGTYETQGVGRNGVVEVSVAFSEDSIEAVEVGKNFETIGVGQRAVDLIPKAIVEGQTVAVDAVSGATLTSNAIIQAVEDCVKQAGGDPRSLAAPQEAAPVELDETFDVIVVGGGGTGCRAAIAAAQLGATVAIVEKADFFGGNTCVSGGIYNAADPEGQKDIEMTPSLSEVVETALAEKPDNDDHKRLQDAVRADWDAYLQSGSTSLFDTPNWHALQTYNGGDRIGNVDLVLTLTTNALPSLEAIKAIGVEYDDVVKQGGGALWQRTHYTAQPLGSGYMTVYEDLIEGFGDDVSVFWSTEATELMTEDGRVVGVKAQGRDGSGYVLRATNGVVMATGGFASNVEMRQKYCEGDKWPDLGSALHTTNMSFDDGSGTLMAEAAGANLVNMDQIQLLHSCCASNGDADWGLKYSVNTSVFVNGDGERFVKEDARRDELCLAIFEQPGKFMYIVQSGDTYPKAEGLIMNDGVPIEESMATGDVFVGDSIEDLATQLGMDAATLQATIDEYNESVETGKDRFGRALLDTKLTMAPWYAMKRAPAAHFTMGGIQIDTECHALTPAGDVLVGLYAAGECAGGIHGGNRLGGNAVASTVIFGQIAGENAALGK